MKFKLDEETNWLERAKIRSKIEKKTRSLRKSERQTYAASAVQMYHDYEETVFNLSDQSKNESIESIKRMSVGQRFKFQELISKRNEKWQTKNIPST